MGRKIKYLRVVTEGMLENMVKERYPDNICPNCGKEDVRYGCLETQYDEKLDKNIVLSFGIFCCGCGSFLDKYDNTNRKYLFGK